MPSSFLSFIVLTPFSVLLNIITIASLQVDRLQLLYFLEKLVGSIFQCDRKSLMTDSFDQHVLIVCSVFHLAAKINSHDTTSDNVHSIF